RRYVFRRSMKCEHDKPRTLCRDCGGGSICEHDRVRSTCSMCSPESVYKQYEHNAKKRNLGFTLTLGEFKQLVQQPCAFCGELGSPRGIDRRDNNIAYVLFNCQACCGPCNFLKGPRTQHDFLTQVLKIARHQEAKTRSTDGQYFP